MADLIPLSDEEARLLDRVGSAWQTYGPALKTKLTIQGNMTWKTAKGTQYLLRYFRDEAGALVNKSLGRRSPETERLFEDFKARREKARSIVAEGEEAMRLVGRLAKAHGLARMPARHADILRAFWRTSLDEQMLLFSGASLFAFERESRMLAPSELTQDEVLTFVLDPRAEQIDFDLIRHAYIEALEVAAAKMDQADGRIRFYSPEQPSLEFVDIRWLADRLDAGAADVMTEAVRGTDYRAVTIAKDSRPVEIRTLDPRAYALTCQAMEGDIWRSRADFMRSLVHRSWGFKPEQEAVMIAFDADECRDRPRL